MGPLLPKFAAAGNLSLSELDRALGTLVREVLGDRIIQVNNNGNGSIGIRLSVENLMAALPKSIIAVKLTQDGGVTGTASSAATYTYTAFDARSGVQLGTTLHPKRPRPNGTATAADTGSGYFDATGVFQLYEALEAYGTGGCA